MTDQLTRQTKMGEATELNAWTAGQGQLDSLVEQLDNYDSRLDSGRLDQVTEVGMQRCTIITY